MDIRMTGPEEIPQPPEKVEIRNLEVEPFPDGKRVKVRVDLTPFLERPMVEVRILGSVGEVLAEATVVECADPSFSLTLHMRSLPPGGEARMLEVQVAYPDLSLSSTKWLRFPPVP